MGRWCGERGMPWFECEAFSETPTLDVLDLVPASVVGPDTAAEWTADEDSTGHEVFAP